MSSLLRHLAIAAVAGVALFLLSGRLSQFDNLQLATMAYLVRRRRGPDAC